MVGAQQVQLSNTERPYLKFKNTVLGCSSVQRLKVQSTVLQEKRNSYPQNPRLVFNERILMPLIRMLRSEWRVLSIRENRANFVVVKFKASLERPAEVRAMGFQRQESTAAEVQPKPSPFYSETGNLLFHFL